MLEHLFKKNSLFNGQFFECTRYMAEWKSTCDHETKDSSVLSVGGQYTLLEPHKAVNYISQAHQGICEGDYCKMY